MGVSFCDDTLLLILSFLIDIWHGLWPWNFPLLKFIWVNIPICLEDSLGQGSFLNFIESPLLLFSYMLWVWWLAFWGVLVLFPSPNLFWTFSLPHLCCSYSIVILLPRVSSQYKAVSWKGQFQERQEVGVFSPVHTFWFYPFSRICCWSGQTPPNSSCSYYPGLLCFPVSACWLFWGSFVFCPQWLALWALRGNLVISFSC